MKFIKKFLPFLLILILNSELGYASSSDWQSETKNYAKVKLITSFYQDEAGQKKLIAGLHFKIQDGWKIYGNGSDSIGLPPSLDFSASENYLSHKIIWPKSEIGKEEIGEEKIEYSYYKNEVILPIEIDLKNLNDATKLKLQVTYGLCKDICIPANAEIELKVENNEDLEALKEIQKFYNQKITKENLQIEKTQPTKSRHLLIYMCLLAILGGAILNIMPCVLPVLSIKLMSVIKHLDAEISRIRFAFFATILGILSCFFFFAFLAIIIKVSGNALGWGMQFQNPYFLVFLIIILGFFIANLLGIFEFSFSQVVATFLDKKISENQVKKNIFIPNFLSGILAVLLATPCSAPFLGTAISFGLSQNILTILIIFISIGAGFALPYIILFFAPKLVYLLPKPGNWMVNMKKLMALFLAATILWLLYIFSNNAGLISAILLAILILLLFLAFKLKSSLTRFALISLIISASFALAFHFEGKNEKMLPVSENIWLDFSEDLLNKSLSEGKTVVIDITADWCLTCKFNKIRVLQDEDVLNALTQENVITLRGNITKPNQKIMDFLHKHNRYAIPFNVIYGPNAKNGLLTNELITKKELLFLIDKAS